MYIFGNMNVLKSASNIWRQINNKLIEQKAIGRKLTLICEDHEKTLDVSIMLVIVRAMIGLRKCVFVEMF